MARTALLILAVLVGSCTTFSDAVEGDVPKDDLPKEKSEKTEIYMPFLCSPLSPHLSPSSSVHALTPADVSSVYTLGIPHSHRDEASRIVSRLAELLSMFNPKVIAQQADQTSLQPRSLLQEAQDLSLSLSHQVTDWKLVLLFVPADFMCACSSNIVADVKTVVQEVEAALQILQKRLHRTLVHVVVWSGYHQEDTRCECMKDELANQHLYKATLLKVLQDNLSHVLKNPKWDNWGVDFTSMLHSAPAILEPQADSEDTWSGLDQLTFQLWTNLLQPLTGEAEVTDSDIITIPCPTQDHPFLRTQINSPAQTEGEAYSNTAVLALGTEIPCTDRSPSPTTPTSVHELKPGDIKVVAAVGDSLTAANGVGAKSNNILLLLNEYRGLSWSIGGDENITTVTTLANILREFNPSLTGFSKGISGADTPAAFLNQAVPGAKSGDMVQQARILVDKMKSDSRIDFYNDWKVITMFVGGNDICDYCTDSTFFSPRNVAHRISEALDLLHREVPRAVVNLVELFDIRVLRDLHKDKSLGCPTWFVNLICSCVLKPKDGSSELQKLDEYNRGYQVAMRQLIDSGRYDTHDNFTVVLQPFFRELSLPRLEDGRPDRSYFAPDCFHLSQKSHTLMARGLWNNMLEPLGNKTYAKNFTAGIDLMCPSETIPFIRTAVNSNYTFPGPPPTSAPVTNWGSDFFCANTAPSSAVPTSAHKVRPADIKVVAALGDSITAGFGAKAERLLELRTEYRGVSWSIGGDASLETVTTLPNILKKFNSNIKGMSKGTGKLQTGFNMAVSGAKIQQIPEQVTRLIDAIKANSAVDFQNDWKLVTLFIGGNDLCQYCNDRVTYSPKNYSYHMMEALDMLYNEVPRTIVNVLGILEIEGLRRIKRNSLGCSVLQQFVCPCFLFPGEDSPELAEAKQVNREFQTETEKLLYGSRYDGKEDFAVVLQPFFKSTIVPLNADGKPDVTYFSEDCFHFSERGHADMAVALWNNMLEPVGEKQTYNVFSNDRNRIKCPTEEQPYIFTQVNSMSASVTTAPPKTDSTSPHTTGKTAAPLTPKCSDSVPIWLAALLAVLGLLIGWGVTLLLLSYKAKKNRKKMMATTVQMAGTAL
ncbi:phospholipase B1, membrane-associated [Archocentrus centrarchus]|uniref:phospholipase B1, membrane-associated n=1 Tax=Archocentrus centrarchus TaxID=63155 RepID=UPI0011EA48C5|nr:phospholipase B1, membrane-associated-like [Archocentrus centrarchus]